MWGIRSIGRWRKFNRTTKLKKKKKKVLAPIFLNIRKIRKTVLWHCQVRQWDWIPTTSCSVSCDSFAFSRFFTRSSSCSPVSLFSRAVIDHDLDTSLCVGRDVAPKMGVFDACRTMPKSQVWETHQPRAQFTRKNCFLDMWFWEFSSLISDSLWLCYAIYRVIKFWGFLFFTCVCLVVSSSFLISNA